MKKRVWKKRYQNMSEENKKKTKDIKKITEKQKKNQKVIRLLYPLTIFNL